MAKGFLCRSCVSLRVYRRRKENQRWLRTFKWQEGAGTSQSHFIGLPSPPPCLTAKGTISKAALASPASKVLKPKDEAGSQLTLFLCLITKCCQVKKLKRNGVIHLGRLKKTSKIRDVLVGPFKLGTPRVQVGCCSRFLDRGFPETRGFYAKTSEVVTQSRPAFFSGSLPLATWTN